jgi:hypothetical protein
MEAQIDDAGLLARSHRRRRYERRRSTAGFSHVVLMASGPLEVGCAPTFQPVTSSISPWLGCGDQSRLPASGSHPEAEHGVVHERSAICAADAAEEPWLHIHRDADAGDRHWRQHRNIQFRRRCAAKAPPINSRKNEERVPWFDSYLPIVLKKCFESKIRFGILPEITCVRFTASATR